MRKLGLIPRPSSGMRKGSDMELAIIEKIILFAVGVSLGGTGLFCCWAAIKLFELVVASKYS